ncbi:heme NO-binding domain-containing protein [Legionella waltersii]|uniref:Guanylate cyclase n=1 Tax=Legionella waltersii TaxID=66969 RepID=A0A0W1AMJ5_9GAMM|nr:heme NO-binding domain-containing protein [Legionella waltersii]KTD82551.1 guanylate cyclase [Legionella waltersii]SNU95177.1 guanylate cyclase [Legionella waltersii]
MKGIVFTALSDMITEQFGIETWDQLVTQLDLPSGGSYTAGGTYEDTELPRLIQTLALMKNLQIPIFLESFGAYMFAVFSNKYPFFLKEDLSLKEFLKSVDGAIHVEVEKLYHCEQLPSITYEEPASNQLIMLYRSQRKLCHLAIGLINGAAKYYRKNIKINQTLCMHQQSDHCRLEITFE